MGGRAGAGRGQLCQRNGYATDKRGPRRRAHLDLAWHGNDGAPRSPARTRASAVPMTDPTAPPLTVKRTGE